MDEVRSTREPVVITKKGRPVAKLVPADGQPDNVFGVDVVVSSYFTWWTWL
jgi:antitoxin (DNA-binding transcriptional repressor) of toxin-antitoxin stability system